MNSRLTKRAASIALGTEKVLGPSCISYIQQGLSAGYRTIDTAQVYQNESEIGQAIRSSSIPRHEIYITNKISSGFKKNPTSVKEATDSARASIERLGTYVDLFLIHQPGDDADAMAKANRRVTWQALEGLVKEGSVMRIGVSNYTEQHILELREDAETYPPEVNQLEVPGQLLSKTQRLTDGRSSIRGVSSEKLLPSVKTKELVFKLMPQLLGTATRLIPNFVHWQKDTTNPRSRFSYGTAFRRDGRLL
jgi:diketogulonate reductase-like aldo/keto reductase